MIIKGIIDSVSGVIKNFIGDKDKQKELTKEIQSIIESNITERHKNDMSNQIVG